ncbi:MAG: glycine--tRNA ligase subunit alpha [Rickettsiaceae bacterium]|nr:glycine--tRNA ligase subunit alpha [Rickettsiaceae bacterium]
MKKLSFQDIILTLQQFWSNKGCVILQSYDAAMGAGTFHPATVLRPLGTKPWNVCYVQPSRRPTDGRYGDHPNRMQHYYQFQVILKPSPDNMQQLYLESLTYLGIDSKKLDIRFVEDDWESPTLGAAGLGWEVWINGMEVSQYTYMQQIGGMEVRPVPGELTYGLERLAMYIQGVCDYKELMWNNNMTYGQVSIEEEKQFCAYNFHHANVEILLKNFEESEKACIDLIASNLPFPAYDFCIKGSHIFNLLNARGVVSTTEREAYIGRIRHLAKICCLKWIEMENEQ